MQQRGEQPGREEHRAAAEVRDVVDRRHRRAVLRTDAVQQAGDREVGDVVSGGRRQRAAADRRADPAFVREIERLHRARIRQRMAVRQQDVGRVEQEVVALHRRRDVERHGVPVVDDPHLGAAALDQGDDIARVVFGEGHLETRRRADQAGQQRRDQPRQAVENEANRIWPVTASAPSRARFCTSSRSASNRVPRSASNRPLSVRITPRPTRSSIGARLCCSRPTICCETADGV